MLSHIFKAISEMLKDKKSRFVFVALWILFFVGMFLIPVRSIPGNDIGFQLKLYGMGDYLFLALLSLASSLIVTLQYFIFVQGHRGGRKGQVALGGVGILTGIFS